VATDALVAQGQRVAEYRCDYGSAALMLADDWPRRLSKPQF